MNNKVALNTMVTTLPLIEIHLNAMCSAMTDLTQTVCAALIVRGEHSTRR